MLFYAYPPIFLSSFLLFQVQPILAKMILPWFGGSAAVWNACMLFFQAALRSYAHLLFAKVPARRAGKIHTGLLALSLLSLPILPGAAWKPAAGENPALQILGLLAATVGLPYFLLSTTGPLLQAWYARQHSGATPYRLFALSNAASLLALLSYPVLVEPGSMRRHGLGLVRSVCSLRPPLRPGGLDRQRRGARKERGNRTDPARPSSGACACSGWCWRRYPPSCC
jgi:hypothetical protein